MDPSIFRAYDVRGIYDKTITDNDMEIIGNSLARVLEDDKVMIARDSRLSSKDLSDALIGGFTKTGKNVIDLGVLPLGAGILYAWKRKTPYAYITGSHLPKEWNGVKFFHKNAIGFMEEDNNNIRTLSLEGKMLERDAGNIESVNTKTVLDEYVDFMVSKIRPEKSIRIVLDCGNGAAGIIARKLFEMGGFEVDVLFEEQDGNFPNRTPDNLEDPLIEARKRVKGADFGVVYDGDGDRITILDTDGNMLSPEHVSYIILDDLLKERDGVVVANVECTRGIDIIANKFNREVKRIQVGHTFLMDSVQKFGASFGVERSGHYVIPSICPADDSLAVSYYFACIMSRKSEKLSEIANNIPKYPFERVNFDCDDDKKFQVIDGLKEKMKSEYGDVNTLDGVRIDLEGGWVLIRPSNTSPVIRLTIEGKDEETFANIKEKFSGLVSNAIESGN
jgi:phosphomannomutase